MSVNLRHKNFAKYGAAAAKLSFYNVDIDFSFKQFAYKLTGEFCRKCKMCFIPLNCTYIVYLYLLLEMTSENNP